MFFRFTPVVKNLMLINLIIFIGQLVVPYLTEYIALYGLRTPYFKPYQLFTYMFAHGGFGHIFYNMLFLFIAGPALEEYWGQKKFLFFYLAAGLGAAVFYIIMDMATGGGTGSMIGASGAVYGVVTAFRIIFPDQIISLFFGLINVRAKYIVLFLGALVIINTVGPFRASGDNIAHLAHLGGIVIAFAFLLYWRSKGRY